MRTRHFLLAATVAATLLAHSPASAHLCIIRQGLESRGTAEAGDHHGQALAAGDFNGDGYDDLAMGAPDEDVGVVGDAGAVIVEWGGPYGLDPAGAQLWTEDDANGGGGVTAGGQFGHALAAADFNGDGFDDLAVGCPGGDAGVAADVGIVYVLRGTSGGLVRWVDLIQSDAGGALEGGDRFGESLATGNFDGDAHPYADLAVGAPGENDSAGAVFWFLSNALGPLGTAGYFLESDFGLTPAAGDRFGFSLAAGDFLSTSHDDLAAGAPYRQVGSEEAAGMVYQIAGSAAGPIAGDYGVLSAFSVDLTQADGHFGYALAVGELEDVAGGHASLAVGEPGRSYGVIQHCGRVIIYEGGTGGVSTAGEIVLTQVDVGSNAQDMDQFGACLAAGRFWDPADGWDDLAVGSPGDGLGWSSAAGQVNILYGGPAGPGSNGWGGFNQATLNEPIEGNEMLGYAPVIGNFDATGFGNLAVGAPGEDAGAGMVHVIAPWRQTYGLSCRHSVAYDCDDNLYFSQKPYDRVLIASTTKILTVLIGCERVQAGLIDLTDEYIVPAWVAQQIGGSQVPLVTGEKVNFWDLMNLCIHLSGNDAAHALADWMTGGLGPLISLPLFIDLMNERAAQIGMTGSHFNNPNGFEQEAVGFDLGDHYSTPVDMALLSQVAMDNPMFRDIVDATTFSVTRQYPVPWMPGTFVSVLYEINTFYSGIILNNIQPAIGIKGGWTPAAQATGCYAAETVLGTKWVAGSYYTPDSAPSEVYVENAGNLLRLGGLSPACEVFSFPIQFTSFTPAWVDMAAGSGSLVGGASEIGWGEAGDLIVRMGPWRSGSDDTRAHVELTRVSRTLIGDGEEALFGVGPFNGHGPITLLNGGSEDVSVEVHLSYAAEPLLLELIPGEPDTVEAYLPEEPLEDFSLLILNVSPGAAADLTVEETYPVDLAFAADPLASREILLRRPAGGASRDGFSFLVEGQSRDADASIYLSVRRAGSEATGVPESFPVDEGLPVLRLRSAYPNPFGAETQILFDLQRRSRVGATVYDLRGRLVRRYEDSVRPPGSHQVTWDGRDGRGRQAAAGVYFLQITVDGNLAGQKKITLVR